MCNLSEDVWEKGVAEGRAKGEINQLVRDVGRLMSNGMKFDEIVNLLDVSSETAEKVRENLTSKTVHD